MADNSSNSVLSGLKERFIHASNFFSVNLIQPKEVTDSSSRDIISQEADSLSSQNLSFHSRYLLSSKQLKQMTIRTRW